MRSAVNLATGAPVAAAAVTAACRGPAQIVARCDLLNAGQFVRSYPIVDATVRFNRGAAQYARLSNIQIHTDNIADLPTRANARLAPGAWELKIWFGVRIPGRAGAAVSKWWRDPAGRYVRDTAGNRIATGGYTIPAGPAPIDAVVPLGVFPIDVSQVDSLGYIDIDAPDRSERLEADRLTSTLVWPGPFASLNAAVDDLFQRTFPGATCQFIGGVHPCPDIAHERDAQPLRIIRDAATSVGCYFRLDGNGNGYWAPEPDTGTTQPELWFTDDPRDGTLVDVKAKVSKRGVVNSWTVTGTNPAGSAAGDIIATVYDDAPDSITRWGGPHGRRPKPATRMELVDTYDKALAAAQVQRAAEIGIGMDIAATLLTNPLVEPGDVHGFRRAAAGLDGPAVIETQTLRVRSSTMDVGARARQAVAS